MKRLLTPEDLHPYQRVGVRHLWLHNEAILRLKMGRGKTITTLTFIAQAMAVGVVNRVLVVAPLRPAKTVWETQALAWEHTKHLTFAYALGSPRDRLAAIFSPADVIVINLENYAWLIETLKEYVIREDGKTLRAGRKFPWDMVVYDELTAFRSATTGRSKAAKVMRRFVPRLVGLTGSLATNGFDKIHGQYLAIDGGVRLGTSKTEFDNAYFTPCGPYKKKLKDYALDLLKVRVSDITYEPADDQYSGLPDVTVNDVLVDLGPLRKAYETFEKDFFAVLESGVQIEAFNRGAVSGKLRQFCQGAVYKPGTQEWDEVHQLKLDALEEIYDETGDEPLFLAYQFVSDFARIKAKYPDAETLSGATAKQTEVLLRRFFNREFRLLCGHPFSAAHGLDQIQHHCNNTIWFGLIWSAEHYVQFNARANRQGQTRPGFIHRILVKDSIETGLMVPTVEGNIQNEEDFWAKVREYQQQKR